jgi:excinuclease ABC subunit A
VQDLCGGARLKPEILAVTFGGINIHDVTVMSAKASLEFFDVELSEREERIARRVIKEIVERLRFLVDVGLDYLTLERGTATLSGGEAQRIRLATQIGSGLMGVLYILDEPSIGCTSGTTPAHRDDGAPARPGQHRDRGRARRGDYPRG